MEFITWDETYAVHVDEIDAQHEWLIDIINLLYAGAQQGRRKRLMEVALAALVQYTQAHFATEEALMRAHHYPGLAVHLALHGELAARILDWQRAYREGQTEQTVEMLWFLKRWLEQHEVGVDAPLGAYLNERGVH